MKRISFFALLATVSLIGAVHGQSHYKVTHLDNTINTTGSEAGAVVVDDSIVLYNTLKDQESSRLYLIDFNPTLTTIYQAPLAQDGTLGKGELNNWGLNANGMNSGNVAYDRKTASSTSPAAAPTATSPIFTIPSGRITAGARHSRWVATSTSRTTPAPTLRWVICPTAK